MPLMMYHSFLSSKDVCAPSSQPKIGRACRRVIHNIRHVRDESLNDIAIDVVTNIHNSRGSHAGNSVRYLWTFSETNTYFPRGQSFEALNEAF